MKKPRLTISVRRRASCTNNISAVGEFISVITPLQKKHITAEDSIEASQRYDNTIMIYIPHSLQQMIIGSGYMQQLGTGADPRGVQAVPFKTNVYFVS